MTLENCQRLLKHYSDLADGAVHQPQGHKDWADVMANARARAKVMEERIAHKLAGKSPATKRVYGHLSESSSETKPKEAKKNGKRTA
jgi:hypothetical protein